MLTPEQYKKVEDLITERNKEVRYIAQVGPDRASEIQVELSSLLAGLSEEMTEREYWFNCKADELLTESGVDARAKTKAKATKEWLSWQQSVGLYKSTKRMIATLDRYLRNVSDEAKQSRY